MATRMNMSAVTVVVVMMLAGCLASLELASAHDNDNNKYVPGQYKKKNVIPPGQYKKKQEKQQPYKPPYKLPPGQYKKKQEKQQEPPKPPSDDKFYRAKKSLQKQKVALAVEGVVLCQNCKKVGTHSLKDAKPLAGAKVQLACRDWQYKTFLYQTATTDAHGYFLIRVPDFDFVKHKPLKACKVFLVSSPSKDCNTRTDIGFGKQGAMLRKVKDYPAHEALYTAGPFAFAPPPCKSPPPVYNSPPPIYNSPPPIYKAPAPPPYKAHN